MHRPCNLPLAAVSSRVFRRAARRPAAAAGAAACKGPAAADSAAAAATFVAPRSCADFCDSTYDGATMPIIRSSTNDAELKNSWVNFIGSYQSMWIGYQIETGGSAWPHQGGFRSQLSSSNRAAKAGPGAQLALPAASPAPPCSALHTLPQPPEPVHCLNRQSSTLSLAQSHGARELPCIASTARRDLPADPPAWSKAYYFWQDGQTPGYGDASYGRVAFSQVFEQWNGGEPNFGGGWEQSAQHTIGGNWNDLTQYTNQYCVCETYSAWRPASSAWLPGSQPARPSPPAAMHPLSLHTRQTCACCNAADRHCPAAPAATSALETPLVPYLQTRRPPPGRCRPTRPAEAAATPTPQTASTWAMRISFTGWSRRRAPSTRSAMSARTTFTAREAAASGCRARSSRPRRSRTTFPGEAVGSGRPRKAAAEPCVGGACVGGAGPPATGQPGRRAGRPAAGHCFECFARCGPLQDPGP